MLLPSLRPIVNITIVKNVKLSVFQAAFTLLELIIVVIILAIIGVYVQARFSSSDSYQQDTVIEQIISAGQLTQQLSMNDSSRNFSLSIQANQINLLSDGTAFSLGDVSFPINFGSKVTLSPVTSVVFDNLGATTAKTITVQLGETRQVCFESSGYIHRC